MPSARDPFEESYRQRLDWWSLQPLQHAAPPPVRDWNWPRNEVDRYILAALEAKGLAPAPEADRRVLARRLSFALTGLPPEPEWVERFLASATSDAYAQLVDVLLASPRFGEHWARHWFDVVHYADTHGYEWDAPAKNAWRYRDYVVRAFNADVPIQRFLQEQIAGDLLEPRVDAATGLNESLIGPMALRLGERRHGDNAAAEGVTQEAVANVIDTIGKGILATTLACAQCHDHKLDPVPQRDFYALSGVFMSTRWHARTVDAVDPNLAVLEELKVLKAGVREEIVRLWVGARGALAARIREWPRTNAPAGFPESLAGFWRRSATSDITSADYLRERAVRHAANASNLTWVADFRCEDGAPGWRWDGFGMRHGLVSDGEIVVAGEGDKAVTQLLPAGRWSHVWSQRLAGALRSPLLDHEPAVHLSAGLAGGRFSAESFIVDQAFHSERMKFLNQPMPAWRALTCGNFDTLEGGLDHARRRVYLEWATKSLNNYFPPRTGYGGVTESDVTDERSWFGVTRICRHSAGLGPRDELGRFAPLFEGDPAGLDWADRLGGLVGNAVEQWNRGAADSECVALLNDAIATGLLPVDLAPGSELARRVGLYRAAESRLQPDRTVGSAEEWNEARDERVGIRGSYTDFGERTPRGSVRFLAGPSGRACAESSGRLELARDLARDDNPLTARVFVNRVWLHLFGQGLVRTPDDFGRLGEKPSHPELLDALALRFMREGWSLKRLVAYLVTSSTWRQDSCPLAAALEVDPENRLWHHLPLRRLEAESIRDALLAVSGRLDTEVMGAPVDPYRTAEDAAKRLFSGPLDGLGHRSLYTKVTLMEPPRFLALFNQPIPKLTTGRRDVTSVPDQALALLNDPFVIAMAQHWSRRLVRDSSTSVEARLQSMFLSAFARPPAAEEVARLKGLLRRSAELRGADADAVMQCQLVWQDVAHAVFNLKEFIHVP